MSYTFLSSSKVFRIFCDFSASFLLRFHHVHHVLCWNGTMVPILTPRIHDDSYCSCCSYSVTEKTGLTHYPTANTLSAGSIWCLQSTWDVLLRGRKTISRKTPLLSTKTKGFQPEWDYQERPKFWNCAISTVLCDAHHKYVKCIRTLPRGGMSNWNLSLTYI